MHQPSTTFEEHIEILAAESPCALILTTEKGVRSHFASSARDGRIRTKEFWRAALERLGKVPA
jgi:hypothetical protein